MVVYEKERGGKVDVVLKSVRGRKAQAFVRCCRVLDVHQLELIDDNGVLLPNYRACFL